MVTLIAGVDTAKSRNYFLELRQKAVNPLTLEGSSLTLNTLIQALEGQGLFDETKQIFIEELFSKKKQSKELDVIILFINNHHQKQEIIIWESKDLTAKQQKSIKNSEVKKFDVPKSIFPLLDSLQPGSQAQILHLFHQTIALEDAEFVFFMLVRHFRILLALSEPSSRHSGLAPLQSSKYSWGDPESIQIVSPEGSRGIDTNSIDEVKRLAPWQKTKMQKQAQLFGTEKLRLLFSELFRLEVGMKTGSNPLSLVQSLDNFFLDL